jgi:hypothetical protein
MNFDKNNIDWHKNSKNNDTPYISILLEKNRFYIRKILFDTIKEKRDQNFNYVKIGLNKEKDKVIINPIFNEKNHDTSYLSPVQKDNAIVNEKLSEKIKNKLKNNKNIKPEQTFRIEAEVIEDDEMGLLIIGSLNHIIEQ